MKFFHTADWHLGKIIQSVHMTEDQAFILRQFADAVREERPDAVIIAGDLYDRAVPPTEAVDLLNNIFNEIVIELEIPVLAIAGNHDSPDRIEFGSRIMREKGLYIAGQFQKEMKKVRLSDEHGPVDFYLVPYADPGRVRHVLQDDEIRTHDDAMRAITARIAEEMDPEARHIFIGHAFVTPSGEKEEGVENASDAERPLSIGGAEYVHVRHFAPFHYTALGHLHQAHYVGDETVRYAGSPLKYSIAEEHHNKGFYIVELDGQGRVHVEKRPLVPRRDMRTVRAVMEELETHERSEDYVFVQLLNEAPVLSAMERVRSVYPNAMHVGQNIMHQVVEVAAERIEPEEKDDMGLFRAFYKEIKGSELPEEKERLFKEVLEEVFAREGERV
jgi:exonuclease SbcD